jgi:hypothetical protein
LQSLTWFAPWQMQQYFSQSHFSSVISQILQTNRSAIFKIYSIFCSEGSSEPAARERRRLKRIFGSADDEHRRRAPPSQYP